MIGANQRGRRLYGGQWLPCQLVWGHLVELSQPEAYDEKYAKWRYDDLPILPDHWRYQVSASTKKKQFGILKKLMQRKDVESLIVQPMQGVGELIFRLVYHQCGCKSRWNDFGFPRWRTVRSRKAFKDREYDALYEAALCRERADWIVGINATG